MFFPRASIPLASVALLLCGSQARTWGAEGDGEPLTFTTRTGIPFNQVVVTNLTPYKIEVRAGKTTQTVRLVDLPESLQKRFAAEAFAPMPPRIGDTLSFTTAQGEALDKAVLRRIEPNGLTVETAEGLQKIAYADLPEHLGAYFEFENHEVARYETGQRNGQAEQARRAQAALASERAAKAKAAAEAAAHARKPVPVRKAEPQLGDRGRENLGSPRLGATGK